MTDELESLEVDSPTSDGLADHIRPIEGDASSYWIASSDNNPLYLSLWLNHPDRLNDPAFKVINRSTAKSSSLTRTAIIVGIPAQTTNTFARSLEEPSCSRRRANLH
jgi:hypothetical protein